MASGCFYVCECFQSSGSVPLSEFYAVGGGADRVYDVHVLLTWVKNY